MTQTRSATDAHTPGAARPPFEFIVLVALLTSMVALSIDSMLPALGQMASELGATHPNDRQFILLGFFAGMTLGTLLFGPLSDALGRKPAILAGLAFFAGGAVLCIFAPSFPVLIAGRALQGFGAAGPRIVSIAMVRDGAKGAAMARVMSFVMSVFMLVPMLAPSLGQFMLLFSGWRSMFVLFIGMAALAALWLAFRQRETLEPENQRPLSGRSLAAGTWHFLCAPVSLGYTLASGALFGAFTCYLSTSQQIFVEQYQQGKLYPLWFGALALAMAIAMQVNARLVRHYPMELVSRRALAVSIVLSLAMVAITFATHGHPPLWVLAVYFFGLFFCNGLMFGNFNAMALEAMGHMAGLAAALSGTLSSLVAVVLGTLAGQSYDGTMIPLSVAFASFSLLSWIAARWAAAHRPPS